MLPNGVTVAQLILVQFVEVRILIGQPFFLSLRRSLPLFLIQEFVFPQQALSSDEKAILA